MKDKNILEEALTTFGDDNQFEKAIEECGEFIVAAQKFKMAGMNENISEKELEEKTADVVDEIADVLIMMYQMRILFGKNTVDKRFHFKIDRLSKTIYNEEQKSNQTKMFE